MNMTMKKNNGTIIEEQPSIEVEAKFLQHH